MLSRKEIKNNYKQGHTRMGVFQIKHTASSKVFLISALNVDGIMNSNRFSLNLGNHRNKALQQDWKTFGADSFSFEVLECLEPSEDPGRDYREEVKVLLEIWLEKLEPYEEKGYHIRKG